MATAYSSGCWMTVASWEIVGKDAEAMVRSICGACLVRSSRNNVRASPARVSTNLGIVCFEN